VRADALSPPPWLKLAGHEHWFFWYVTGCILCSLLVHAFMRDTRRHNRFD
jgi:MHS family alpha-ketoglutarate permease-like MFS transporter